MGNNRGIPFFKIYTAKDYGANSQNFDVICDAYGTVFLANFEGLLYYDGATWRKVYTPGMSRVTQLAQAKDGRIWIGGYNVIGYLQSAANGSLKIKTILSDVNNKGDIEIDLIKPVGNKVYMHTTRNRIFVVGNDDKITELKKAPEGIDLTPAVNRFPKNLFLPEVIGDKMVNDVSSNGHNILWGAMAQGVIAMEVNSPFSRLTEDDGLKGEVYAIGSIGKTIYIGTQDGLYRFYGNKVMRVKEVKFACWGLQEYNGGLLVPTSNGLYLINEKGRVSKLSDENTLSVAVNKKTHELVTGEIEGMFRITAKGKRTKLDDLQKVVKCSINGNTMTVKTIYGYVWEMVLADDGKVKSKKCTRNHTDTNDPIVEYKDRFGRLWQTDGDGYKLKVNGRSRWNAWIYPLRQKSLNTLFVNSDGDVFAGGDFGVIIIDAQTVVRSNLKAPEQPYIREVASRDSVFWGGYQGKGFLPKTDIPQIDLPDDFGELKISFSIANSLITCPAQYRYKYADKGWSSWSNETSVTYKNLDYGDTRVEVQAKDSYGRISKTSTVNLHVDFPFFLRWYAWVFYTLMIIGLGNIFYYWRVQHLRKDKEKLEGLVKKRTSELSNALDDLKKTQDSLVRMERTATAGKLTQGLIDRILNPINYINNFSKLTSGLAKDLREDIEEEKENMSKDNYEDCDDILKMMSQNLGKIEEHGVNTTRTLRSMEAILNTHIGTLAPRNLSWHCKEAVKVIQEYYKDLIAKTGIKVSAQVPDDPVVLDLDADAISKILLSMLTNSIYSVEKKYGQAPYNPEVTLMLEDDAEAVRLTVHDNGVGIEDSIKEKIFDPFFTTKPTGVGAGVGLYLVRELVHDQNAKIDLDSERGSYCNFIITFPKN